MKFSNYFKAEEEERTEKAFCMFEQFNFFIVSYLDKYFSNFPFSQPGIIKKSKKVFAFM